jgi:hypothetical protein
VTTLSGTESGGGEVACCTSSPVFLTATPAREKIAQALRNPFHWGAYVIVCGFASPEHRIRFSAHAWEESAHAEGEG